MRLSTGCVLTLAMLLLPASASTAADSSKVKALEAKLKALREQVKKAEGELEKAKKSDKESATKKRPGHGHHRRHHRGFSMHHRWYGHRHVGWHRFHAYGPWRSHRSPFAYWAHRRFSMHHKKPTEKKTESKKPAHPKFPRFGFRRPFPKKKPESKPSVEQRLDKIAKELESIRRELKK